MKTFRIESKEGKFTLDLPTDLHEITPKYLTAVTKAINPAKHYAVIALVYRTNFNSILTTLNRKDKTQSLSCIPIFVKANSDEVSYNTGDMLIMAPGDMALGHHVVSKYNGLSIEKVAKIGEGAVISDSPGFPKKSLATDYTQLFFVDFKVVPMNTIHGSITDDSFSIPEDVPQFIHKETVAIDKLMVN